MITVIDKILKKACFIFLLITLNEMSYSQVSKTTDIDMIFISEIFPEADIRDLQISFELWVTELFQQAGLDYNINLVLINSEKYLAKEYNEDSAYMIVLSSIDYMKSKNNRILRPLITTADKEISSFLLITKKSITTVEQLKDSKILLAKRGFGLIANFWMNCYLTEKFNTNSKEYLKSINYLSSESKCLTSVFFNKADACVISDQSFQLATELNPQMKNKVNVLLKSDKLLHNLFCLTGKFTKEESDKLEAAAYAMENTARGKQLLSLFKQNRLRPFQVEDLIGIEKLFLTSRKAGVSN